MSPTKPDCRDFIPVALRRIRFNPPNMKEGTKAGTALHRLWMVASDAYSETEFREGLASLLQDKTITAVWRVVRFTKDNGCKVSRSEIVEAIPLNMNLERAVWLRDKDGNTTDCESKEYDMISGVKLYITADGLPEKVAKLDPKKSGTLATRIIAGMQQQDH